MTDNRMNEPREAQVEAAAKALHETRNPWIGAYGDWGAAGYEIKQAFRESASAALEAAQGAARPVNSFDTTAERVKTGADSLHVAPQEPSRVNNANGHSWMTWDESGKNGTYCRSCGGWAGKVGNRQCSPAPVLPSSGVDEDERDAALAAIGRIRQAVSGHPECDRYEEGDIISCGWKSAYASVVAALDGAPEPDNYDQCDAEVYSWDHYRPEQIDSYWIRCTLIGKHDEHEDSHTGLKWRSGLPVEGEKP